MERVGVTGITVGIIEIGAAVIIAACTIDRTGRTVEPVLGFRVIQDGAGGATDLASGLNRWRGSTGAGGRVVVDLSRRAVPAPRRCRWKDPKVTLSSHLNRLSDAKREAHAVAVA